LDHTIVHFEIPANDVEKLKKFYQGLFDWKFIKYPGMGPMEYWSIETVPTDKTGKLLRPGLNGGLYPKQTAENKPINYIAVESADQFVEKIKKLGGKIVSPKQEIPQIGWWVLALDPEGNLFGLLEPMMPMAPKPKPKAKPKKK
jgi:predicted enzyme related to lactoylglutathione lyase